MKGPHLEVLMGRASSTFRQLPYRLGWCWLNLRKDCLQILVLPYFHAWYNAWVKLDASRKSCKSSGTKCVIKYPQIKQLNISMKTKMKQICREKRLFSPQNTSSFFCTISICKLPSLHFLTIFTKHKLDLIIDNLFLLWNSRQYKFKAKMKTLF